jgi:hypothetical protein
MALGQNDAAMIHLRWDQRRMVPGGKSCPLNQRAAAGRTPIGSGRFVQHRSAIAANPFHSFQITGLAGLWRETGTGKGSYGDEFFDLKAF